MIINVTRTTLDAERNIIALNHLAANLKVHQSFI